VNLVLSWERWEKRWAAGLGIERSNPTAGPPRQHVGSGAGAEQGVGVALCIEPEPADRFLRADALRLVKYSMRNDHQRELRLLHSEDRAREDLQGSGAVDPRQGRVCLNVTPLTRGETCSS